MEKKELEQLEKWADEFCQENDLFLVRMEQVGAKITVYADGIENITIQQCGKMSRYLQAKLDESSELLTHYSFDVSSPGMSNSLIHPFQFQKRIGKDLDIKLKDGTIYEGKLIKADDNLVEIQIITPKNKKTKEEEKIDLYKINYSQIEKAIIPLPKNFKK